MKRLALGLAGLVAGALLGLGGATTDETVTAAPKADVTVENIIW